MIGENVGKYRVLNRIGRGGMGTVYRAHDETLDRDVAIKVLNPELNDPELVQRFRAEAITVARLNDPGIATIYELLQHDDQWLMVMEFVRGETLERLVERAGALAPERAADLCAQALTALGHAHRMGVIHRDLKPANLMMTESGAIKIMDFGIARVTGTDHLTHAGSMMGTPAYMAPEQVLGREIDARADLYAMGVVLYRMVAGKLPFKGDTPFAIAQSQVNDPPTPIRLARESVPAWIELVTGKALAKSPAARFQTAEEFSQALRRGVAGFPLDAPTVLAEPGDVSAMTLGVTMPAVLPATNAPMTGGPATGAPTLAGPTTGGPATSAPSTSAPATMPSLPTVAESKGPETVTLKKRNLAAIGIGAAVLVVLLIGVVAYLARARTSQPPAPAATAVSAPAAAPDQGALAPVKQATDLPPAPPPAAPATKSEPSPPVPAPVTAAAPSRNRETGAVGTATGKVDSSLPVGPVAPTTAPARGRDAAAAAAAAPAAGRAAVPADPPVAFVDVKVLDIKGNKADDQDVVLNLAAGQMSVVPKKGGTALRSIAYAQVRRATYSHTKDPLWDPSFASPPANLDIAGVFRSSRHWLTLQTSSDYVVLRLADSNWSGILQTIESRMGLTIDRRPSSDK